MNAVVSLQSTMSDWRLLCTGTAIHKAIIITFIQNLPRVLHIIKYSQKGLRTNWDLEIPNVCKVNAKAVNMPLSSTAWVTKNLRRLELSPELAACGTNRNLVLFLFEEPTFRSSEKHRGSESEPSAKSQVTGPLLMLWFWSLGKISKC